MSRSRVRPAWANQTLRVVTFLIPTLAGVLAAWAVLTIGDPFDSRADHILWFVGAIAASLAVSGLVSMLLARARVMTRLVKLSSEFDSEMTARFKSALRAGNTRTLVRTGKIDLSRDEQFVHAIRLLDRVTEHDRMTRGHSERVRAYSTLIGEQLHLSPEEIDELSWSALLHDVGKLDVASETLNSPDRPTEEQWEEIRGHPGHARQYLEPLEPWLGDTVYHAAEGHHERWDGDGYPRGLAGEEIPQFGRIVAVADAFDVMTSTRSYKTPLPIDEARRRLAESSGTQFDPMVVGAFLRIGEPQLRRVRGAAAILAGASAAGMSALVATGAQAVVAATIVVGTAIATERLPPPDPPDAIAFATTTTTTSTTEAPTSTSTSTSTSTTTSTTTTEAPTTTVEFVPTRQFVVQYEIGSIVQDGQRVTVDGDRVEVFLDEVPNTVVELNGRRSTTVVLDVTNVAAGWHLVRFDLYDGDRLVSSDTTRVNL